MRILKIAHILPLTISIFSVSGYADTQTIVSIKKITTISGSELENFKKIFGEASISSPEFSIHCDKKSCEITTTRSGISGEIAKQLLNGRKDLVFSSDNKKFKLHCGEASVHYCNITQDDGILK
ncbi:MAG: hypothetical protein M3R00_08705 [Pseudomonadota bacterium]|nr:hypothetical protein [Pseudomonadota bacterium]